MQKRINDKRVWAWHALLSVQNSRDGANKFQRQIALLLLLYYSKAFDLVDQDVLPSKIPLVHMRERT